VPDLQFKGKLQTRAEQFIRALASAGIEAAIVENSYRRYSVKVSIHAGGHNAGNAIVYYSSKSDSFSLKLHEMTDLSFDSVLEDLWRAESSAGCAPKARYEIYVDGSFINGSTGYGAVVLRNEEIVDELFGSVDNGDVNGTRQVAGELEAVKEALKWCRAHSVGEVDLYYDYLGIEKWATGQWKTNQRLTKEYALFVRTCPIRIHWHKVQSHTGNRWNDRADALAKKGAGSVDASEAPNDLIAELLEIVDRWTEFLMVRGVEAQLDRVYNAQFARVVVIENDKAAGIIDLYNTRKKRFSPYVHDFRDEALKLRTESLWREFRSTVE
jgi:viroplasmin and RNaseH domain-containing protein